MKAKIVYLLMIPFLVGPISCEKERYSFKDTKTGSASPSSLSPQTRSQVGSLTIGETIVQDINKALLNSGYSQKQADTIAAGALVIITGGNDQGAGLRLNSAKIDLNKVDEVAPLIVIGAIRAISATEAELGDDSSKIKVANIITEALFKSLGDKMTDLSTDKRQLLPGLITGNAIGALDDGGLQGNGLNMGIGTVMGGAIANLDSAGYKSEELTFVLEKITAKGTEGLKEAGVEKKNIRYAMGALMGAATGSLDDAGASVDSFGDHLNSMMATTVANLYILGVADSEMQNVVANMASGAIGAASAAKITASAKVKELVDGCLTGTMQGMKVAGIASDKVIPVMDDMVKGSLVGLKSSGLSASQDIIAVASNAVASTIEYLDKIGIKDEATIKAASRQIAKGTSDALSEHQKSGLLAKGEVKAATGQVAKVATKALLDQQRSLKVGNITDFTVSFSDGLTEGLQIAGWQKSELLAIVDTASSGSQSALTADNKFDKAALDAHMADIKSSITGIINEIEILCKKEQGIWHPDKGYCDFPTPTPPENATLPTKGEEDKCYDAGGFIMFKADGSYFCDALEGLEFASKEECESGGYHWILADGGAYQCRAIKPESTCYEKTDSSLCEKSLACIWADGHCRDSALVSCAINKTADGCRQSAGCIWNGTANYCENVTLVKCEEHTASDTCLSQLGCYWNKTDKSCKNSTQVACSASSNPQSCADNTGCLWIGDANSGYCKNSLLVGCHLNADESSCSNMVGCYWDIGNNACQNAQAISCAALDAIDSCRNAPGCLWDDEVGAGCINATFIDCVANATFVDCNAAKGCFWQQGENRCLNAATISCRSYTSLDTCNGTSGCSWNGSHNRCDNDSYMDCNAQVTKAGCDNLGSCFWDVKDPQNLNDDLCTSASNIECKTHTNADSCISQSGCLWKKGDLATTSDDICISRAYDEVVKTNDSPTWAKKIPDFSHAEDQPLTDVFAVATDPNDGDTIAYAFDTAQMSCDNGSWVGFNIDSNTGEIKGTPTNSDIGSCTIEIKATDGVYTISQSVTVTVLNSNDLPTWTKTVANFSQVEYESLTGVQVEATDVDEGETPSYSLKLPEMDCDDGAWEGLAIDATTGVISGQPTRADVGSCSFKVAATSGADTIYQSFMVTVTAIPPSDPSAPSASVNSDSQIILSWTSGGGSTTDYLISYRVGPSAPADCFSDIQIDANAISGTSHIITGLTPEQQYSFRICAIDSTISPLGVSPGVELSAITQSQAVAPDPDTPSATVDAFSTITLNWMSQGGTTAGFRISYQAGADAPSTCMLGTVISEGEIVGTSHTVRDLNKNTAYSFRICAINANAIPDISAGVTILSKIPVMPTSYTQIVAGFEHSCGLTTEGLAYCWGSDNYGQLGNGAQAVDPQDHPAPVAGHHSFISLTAGYVHTCGIVADGKAYCWGDNDLGQLGNGQISTSAQHEPTPVSGDHRFRSLTAGDAYTCGISENGTAYCWGHDGFGQLGNGSTLTADTPTPAQVTASFKFRSLTAGANHICGISMEGAAYCWGKDSSGQLGNGAVITSDKDVPVEVTGGYKFRSLAASYNKTCGIGSDGISYCFGKQINSGGTASYQHVPNQIGGSYSFKSLHGGDGYACGLGTGGKAYCWGKDNYGQLGNGTATSGVQETPTLVTGVANFNSLAAGEYHSCGILADGKAYCWGDNEFGQLGVGTLGAGSMEVEPRALLPVNASGPTMKFLAAGHYHTCGLRANGKAYCWGQDEFGQLGNGTAITDNKENPVVVSGSYRFASLTAGAYHSCGLRADAKAYCWGKDEFGQLGNGAAVSANQDEPVVVAGSHSFVSLTSGAYHSCGLRADGAAYCWGKDDVGQLGDGGSLAIQEEPVVVAGSHNFISITGGDYHTCGLRIDGDAYCWGKDELGQLGNGAATSGYQAEPVLVASVSFDEKFISLTAGAHHTCGIVADGQAYCWGGQNHGELGDGATSTNQEGPVAVSGSHRFIALTAGDAHTCGLDAGRNALCWGINDKGQLGNGTLADASTPSLVTGSHSFISLTAGKGHTCGIKVDGAILCWGQGDFGQLGSGTPGASQSNPSSVDLSGM